MTGPGWGHFPHAADIGIIGRGATLAAAFEQAALGLTAVICDPALVKPRACISALCEAPDAELLLVDWLNAIVYEMATRHMLFSRFEVITDGRQLQGRLWGEQVDVARHQPAVEVKGATYTELKVERDNGLWQAQCVVDV